MTDPAQLPLPVIEHLAAQVLTPERRARLEAVASQRLNCLTLVCEGSVDPHNVSACIRSAEAFGVPSVCLVAPQRVGINKTIAASTRRWVAMRHFRRMRTAARTLGDEGFQLIGTMPAPEAVPFDALPLPPKLALIMGSERDGLSDAAKACCASFVTIPMHGFAESLNISVAAAILLRHFAATYRATLGQKALLEPKAVAQLLHRWLLRDIDEKTRGRWPALLAGDSASSACNASETRLD